MEKTEKEKENEEKNQLWNEWSNPLKYDDYTLAGRIKNSWRKKLDQSTQAVVFGCSGEWFGIIPLAIWIDWINVIWYESIVATSECVSVSVNGSISQIKDFESEWVPIDGRHRRCCCIKRKEKQSISWMDLSRLFNLFGLHFPEPIFRVFAHEFRPLHCFDSSTCTNQILNATHTSVLLSEPTSRWLSLCWRMSVSTRQWHDIEKCDMKNDCWNVE